MRECVSCVASPAMFCDSHWARLGLIVLALGSPALALAPQQAIAAPAVAPAVKAGAAAALGNAPAPIGRVLNAQHDIANEVRARQGLVAAAQARGQRQGAFLSCPAGLRPWCAQTSIDLSNLRSRISSDGTDDDDDDESVAELFEVRRCRVRTDLTRQCINPLTATRQCGGCLLARDEEGAVTRGDGVDCLAAPGVKAASCASGRCLASASPASRAHVDSLQRPASAATQ